MAEFDNAVVRIQDIEAADRAIAPHIVRTPLLESARLNALCGGRILLKAECLQKTGSFKIRGALNKLSTLSDTQRRQGVLAFSSGNHGQGVAAAARVFGTHAAILMPSDSPRVKIDSTCFHGAEVVLYDRFRDDREALAKTRIAETGATLVHPFEDEWVIAGQGTIGLEIARQIPLRDIDNIIVPVGGGGLIAGISIAVLSAHSSLSIYAAEPTELDDTGRSLRAGQRLRNAVDSSSICDALRSPTPGAMTFEINHRLLAGGLTATDDEVRQAMALAFYTLKVVIEPGGAIALAAALRNPSLIRNRTTVIVASGGNVDGPDYADALLSVPTGLPK